MAETASGERRDERALVDDAAARNVDERALGTERVDYGRGNELAALRTPLARHPPVISSPPPPHRLRPLPATRNRLSPRPTTIHITPHPAARHTPHTGY